MASRRTVKAKDENGIDLRALFDEFQSFNISKGLSKATIISYEDSFRRFHKSIGEPSITPSVTEDTIRTFIAHLRSQDIKLSSINHYLRDLRAYFYYCMDKKEIKDFKIRLMKVQEEAPVPYCYDDLVILTKEPLKEESFVVWRSWAMIYWMLDTGNRAQTVCNIKMGDINGRTVKLTHTKNKKAQMVELGASLMPILQKYIRKFRYDAAEDDYLFPSVSGEMLTVNAMKQSIRDYNLKRGVKKTSIHDFRRTYTTMALASGNTTEQEVADRLGHGNTSLLKRYAAFTTDQKRRFHDASSPLNQLVPKKRGFIRRNNE